MLPARRLGCGGGVEIGSFSLLSLSGDQHVSCVSSGVVCDKCLPKARRHLWTDADPLLKDFNEPVRFGNPLKQTLVTNFLWKYQITCVIVCRFGFVLVS